MTLTEPGQRFLASARALVADFDAIVGGMKRSQESIDGHLRIKAPTSLTVFHLGRILSEFQTAHDRVTMDVVLIDRSVNPLEEGFDVALGAMPASYDAVLDEPLCPLNQQVCASPTYRERRGVPKHPSDLAEHDCLVFRPTGTTWMFRSPKGWITVDVPMKLVANDMSMLLAAASAGNGVAILSNYVTRDALRSGELVPLLSDFPLPEVWLKALVPKRKVGTKRIDALLECLRARLSPVPPWEIE